MSIYTGLKTTTYDSMAHCCMAMGLREISHSPIKLTLSGLIIRRTISSTTPNTNYLKQQFYLPDE